MTNTKTPLQNTNPIQRILHPRIGELMDDVGLMLNASSSSNILLVCGPTGVGKSTLGEYIVEAELKKSAAEMAADPGFVPAIRVQASASGEKEFSWRLFFEKTLDALEGDLDAPRTDYRVDPMIGRVVRQMGPQTRRLAGLRTAVERSLRQRKTRFVVIDEAVFMMHRCNPAQLEAQSNTLRSLSNESGVQWILLGSYDLFELLTLNAQLARRIHVHHFSRYRLDNDADAQVFRICLKKFGQWFPALKDHDLLAYSELFHQNTLGCIGTLRTVLERLDRFVAARGWSETALRAALMTEVQVTQIMREINDGEERIAPALSRSFTIPTPATHQKKIA